MSTIVSIAATLVIEAKTYKGILTIYDDRLEFCGKHMSCQLEWYNIAALRLTKASIETRIISFGFQKPAVRFVSGGKGYTFIMTDKQIAHITQLVNQEKEKCNPWAAKREELIFAAEQSRKEFLERNQDVASSADMMKQTAGPALLELKRAFREELLWCRANIPLEYCAIEQAEIDPAIYAKRQGKYLQSIKLYFSTIKRLNMITPSIAHGIFKTLLAAGAVRDAAEMTDYIVDEGHELGPAQTLGTPGEYFENRLYLDSNIMWLKYADNDYWGIVALARNASGNPLFRLTPAELDVVMWSQAEEDELIIKRK